MAKVKEIARGIEQKGFQEKEKTRHTFYFYHDALGKKTRVYTFVSRGRGEVGKPLMATMASQCKLSLEDFNRLIDCSLEQLAYEEMLRETGHLEKDDNTRSSAV